MKRENTTRVRGGKPAWKLAKAWLAMGFTPEMVANLVQSGRAVKIALNEVVKTPISSWAWKQVADNLELFGLPRAAEIARERRAKCLPQRD